MKNTVLVRLLKAWSILLFLATFIPFSFATIDLGNRYTGPEKGIVSFLISASLLTNFTAIFFYFKLTKLQSSPKNKQISKALLIITILNLVVYAMLPLSSLYSSSQFLNWGVLNLLISIPYAIVDILGLIFISIYYKRVSNGGLDSKIQKVVEPQLCECCRAHGIAGLMSAHGLER